MRRTFNLAVSRTRIIVENVIGKVKRRFKVLEEIKQSLRKVPKLILGCCVLYNVYLTLDMVDVSDLFEGLDDLDD